MRFETIDALSLLVSTYTQAIEATGAVIDEETVELIGNDPFKACEALNALAVNCKALDAPTDEGIAVIYESMDATDAHSEPTPEACERCAAAFAKVHVEPPEPEPEPEAEDSDEYEGEFATDTLFDVEADEVAPVEEAPKKRRTRRTHKAASAEASEEAPTEAPSEEPKASEPEAPAKSKKKGAPKSKATKSDEAKAAKSSDGPTFEGEAFSVDQALAILGITRPKLTKLIESGELPAYKKGRSWQISASAVLDKAAGK